MIASLSTRAANTLYRGLKHRPQNPRPHRTELVTFHRMRAVGNKFLDFACLPPDSLSIIIHIGQPSFAIE